MIMKSTTTQPRLSTLIVLSAIAVLPVNTILPSLPNIAEAFQADFALINLSVVGYAVFGGLTQLITGAMSDRYGRRPVVLTALLIFIAASIGCAFAPNIEIFLLFRIMQAGIAAGYSISLVVIKETSRDNEAASKIGYVAMAWAIAPMIGPTLGGLLDELLGWRAIFIVFAILGLIILVISTLDLRETAAHSPKSKPNYLNAYRQLLGSVQFWGYTLCMACSIGTLYIFLGGAPLTTAQMFGGSSAKLGLYMGLIPAGFILGSYLTGRYSSQISLITIILFGRLLTCVGLFVGLFLSMSGTMHPLSFFGPCLFIGLGNGLTMPAANASVLSIHPNLFGTTSGLATAMTIAGGALVAFVSGLFLTETNTIAVLFGLMLASSILALMAAFYIFVLNRYSVGMKP